MSTPEQPAGTAAVVYGLGNPAPLAVLPHGPAPVSAVAWSADGKHVATGCRKGDVVVWDAKSFQELRRTRIGGRGGEGIIHALAFAPDGLTLVAAVGFDEGPSPERVATLDVATGERIGRDITGFTTARPGALAFSPDGKTLVVGCSGVDADRKAIGEVRVFTTEPAPAAPAPGALRPRPVTTDRAAVAAVTFAPDGKSFATAGADGVVDLYAADTLRPTATSIRVKAPGPGALAFFPTTGFLATADEDGVKLHDPRGIKMSHLAWAYPARRVAFAPDGSRAALRNGSVVRLVALPPVPIPGNLIPRENTDEFPPLAWSPDGKRLVAATRLPGSGYWSLEDRTNPGEPKGLTHSPGKVGGMAWSRDGKVIVTGGHDGKVIVTDAATLTEVRKWEAGRRDERAEVRSLVLTPDGRTVLAGVKLWRWVTDIEPTFSSQAVIGWELATGREVVRVELPPGGAVDALALSPDGRLLVAGRAPVEAPEAAPKTSPPALLVWERAPD
jgi:WD40 repeat protein